MNRKTFKIDQGQQTVIYWWAVLAPISIARSNAFAYLFAEPAPKIDEKMFPSAPLAGLPNNAAAGGIGMCCPPYVTD